MMRRLMGFQPIEMAIAKLQQELAETKGGVSGTQGQVGEILSHLIVLRQEHAASMRDVIARLDTLEKLQRERDAAELPAGAFEKPRRKPDEQRQQLVRSHALGLRCLTGAARDKEAAALAQWYALASAKALGP